jgi:hypothetical protein
MPEHDNRPFTADGTNEYTIFVEGVLDTTWSEWFDGMAIRHGSDDTTVISGHVADQAALHRVIRKIRDLGVTLISIQRGGSHGVKQKHINEFQKTPRTKE